MFSGITGMLQKQGNTEAVPVGRKSVGVTFTSYLYYTTIFNNSQYIKNIDILLFIVKSEKEPRNASSGHTCDDYLLDGRQTHQAGNADPRNTYTMNYIIVK
jgi:hypothetical protein